MSRLCLYDIRDPEVDRWVPGDRYVRPIVRRIVRGKHRPGGLDRVLINLCLGLDELGERYVVNLPFRKLKDDDRVCVLGRGVNCLMNYHRPNRIMGGIGMMTHPAEWPDLFERYPIVRYLQHCEWGRRICASYYGEDKVACWPVGIDTKEWAPAPASAKTVDFLVYDKIRWEHSRYEAELLNPIFDALRARQLTWETVRYGAYRLEDYRAALVRCRAMLFLCEHESQGIAYQEAMSAGVPVLAWDPGWWLDPNRFQWNADHTPASSVPFFDARCGRRFRDFAAFPAELDAFVAQLRRNEFDPRAYIVETLPLAKCAAHFLRLANEVLP